MQKITLILLFFNLLSYCYSQDKQKFNLDFEDRTDKNELSEGWFKWGNYELSIVSESYSGDEAGKITSDEGGSSFGSIVFRLPANYKGDSIQLEGYMKTKDVSGGYAGLLLRIDGSGGPLEFDNMSNHGVSGTNGWEKHSITLPFPDEAEQIYVAGILAGKGEAWFDGFTVTINGEDIQTLAEVEKPIFEAHLDKEFDNGSQIEINSLTKEKISNLELLGRIWGFLKYYHPSIGAGKYNWDYELFRILSRYLEVAGAKERNELLVKWIDTYGEVAPCETCKPPDQNAVLKPDLEWIKSIKNNDLKKRLDLIYSNRHQGDHFYFSTVSGVGNPAFKNENNYRHMPYPDDGFRLLTLYRFWNVIQYFSPNRHLMDKEWGSVLSEYIPLFINAADELEYESVSIKLIGEIQDTHANFLGGADKFNLSKGGNFPPFHLRFIENQLVVTDYYNTEYMDTAGVDIGDVITHIDGKQVSDLIRERSAFYPASNKPTQLRDMANDLLRSNKQAVSITLRKDNEIKNVSLQLYPESELSIYKLNRPEKVESYKFLEDSIGYVTLQTIKNEDFPKIKESFKDARGIIIDIRNYPSAFTPFQLGDFFISKPTPFAKFTTVNTNNPGEFTFTEPVVIQNFHDYYKGKLIVLVNEISQSQSEYTAMAFKAADNVTIVGSTTAGADGNVSSVSLPGGLRTMISGIGVYYPDGVETQRIGIVPDIEVKPTIEGIREGRDEVLEKAIELIIEE